MKDLYWKQVNIRNIELEGPYECPDCQGHIMIDATYLDQVETLVICPYCGSKNYVRKEEHKIKTPEWLKGKI